MMLKTPKKKGGKRKKDRTREDDDNDDEDDLKAAVAGPESEPDPDDSLLSTPMPRYNAMLAVLRNTLYMHVSYGLPTISRGLILRSVMGASSNEALANSRSMISMPLPLTRWTAMSA